MELRKLNETDFYLPHVLMRLLNHFCFIRASQVKLLHGKNDADKSRGTPWEKLPSSSD